MKHSIPIRRPWLVLCTSTLLLVVAAVFSLGVQRNLTNGGFEDTGAESAEAEQLIAEHLDAGDPDAVIIATAVNGDVDDPETVQAGVELIEEINAREDVENASGYWTMPGATPLRSTEGDKAVIFVAFNGTEDDALEAAAEMMDEYRRDGPILSTAVGGRVPTQEDITRTVEEDLVTAELVAIPVTLILLILIFGSIVAAVLPVAVGGVAIVGTLFVLQMLTHVMEVSVFGMNFTTGLGLGLGIDYALLVVNRFREELTSGFDVPTAAERTRRTAGRTVLFSGLTVASSLIALAVFQFEFMRSFAWAGMAVVGLAVVGAVWVLPSILTLLGTRVNWLAIRKIDVRPPEEQHEGVWHRLALFVMAHPIIIASVTIAVLLVLGSPFLRLKLGFPDDRVLPAGTQTREVAETLRTEFSSREATPVSIVVRGVNVADDTDDAASVDEFAQHISGLPSVTRVDGATGIFMNGAKVPFPSPFTETYAADSVTLLSAVADIEPYSDDGRELVEAIRSLEDPPGEIFVGGSSAVYIDAVDGMLRRTPLALGLIAVITFIVLFMSFGSILMPIKAIVLNLLSLTATLGSMVWIFQEGRFEDLLNFTATETMVLTMPMMMFVIAFGLSMDYEVFILSRVKEAFDDTGENEKSVAQGLEQSGRIVTAAAVLIAVVFVSFGLTSSVSLMKLFGFGMTLAVLVDAFVVRTALMPAFMRLAGVWNWWAPKPMRQFQERYGFSETVDLNDLVEEEGSINNEADNVS